MKTPSVAITTSVGVEGASKVDLPLDAGSLNERLYEIGIWLIERNIRTRRVSSWSRSMAASG